MTIGQVIALIKALGGSGSSLPSVSSSDNGKVLAVKDGAWAADSNLFLVTITYANFKYSSDKTYEEIFAAIEAGRTVVAQYSTDYYVVIGINSANNLEKVEFCKIDSSGNFITYVQVKKNGSVAKFNKSCLLPTASSSNNGSELIVKNGSWAAQQKKFIVTLTPTSPDYSGTMDKTVAEINTAYENGQEIIFHVVTGATTYVEVPASFRGRDTSYDYHNFGAEIIQSGTNMMIVAETGDTSDGTKATYTTTVYSLTPAS